MWPLVGAGQRGGCSEWRCEPSPAGTAPVSPSTGELTNITQNSWFMHDSFPTPIAAIPPDCIGKGHAKPQFDQLNERCAPWFYSRLPEPGRHLRLRSTIRRSVHTMPIRTLCVSIIAFVILWLRPLNFSKPMGPVEIYRGVWYSCERIEAEHEGRGLAHIVQVDLAAPGVDLYVTPVDPAAVRDGAQYRLAFAQSVANKQQLAVLVNGTMFRTHGTIPWPGNLADSHEMLVAAGEVNHPPPNSYCYLIWFDQRLTPRMEITKVASLEAAKQAKWAISGVSIAISNGQILTSKGGPVDRRTVIGIDSKRALLWLAVFENASYYVAARTLADVGATDAILLDGGDSTSMVIGTDSSTQVPNGEKLGGLRPVATFFGVRADPIEFERTGTSATDVR